GRHRGRDRQGTRRHRRRHLRPGAVRLHRRGVHRPRPPDPVVPGQGHAHDPRADLTRTKPVTFISYTFLFMFLPIAVAGFYVLSRLFNSEKPALGWLVAASLVFYASLGIVYLPVLIGSVVVNFLIARG